MATGTYPAQPALPALPAPATQAPGPVARTILGTFVAVPLAAVVIGVPIALSHGWVRVLDIVMLVVIYAIGVHGITIGYHRYFTHGSFKANRTVKIILAVFGSLAIEGSLDQWVADHRKHHKFSDEVGDPHSPWRFGTSKKAIGKGLLYSHVGWLFDNDNTGIDKYAPDIAADKDLNWISKHFSVFVIASLLLPAVLGGLITWSWMGAVTAFFWAGLVRVAFVHHVTWSINSICHVFGNRPFTSRDLSSNVAWLAIPSLGESWHNLHHVDPTAARHGVMKGQIDVSASVIKGMEKTGLATEVRWPKPERLVKKLKDPNDRFRLRGYTGE